MRAPLWAARCLGRIGVRDCRCSLVRPPLWATHWSARTALLVSANAGVGDALRSLHPNAEEFRCSAVRAPLWAAHCRCRSGMPKTFVALQRARRCGLRVAFVASEHRSAHAAVGCVLHVSHPRAAESRLFAARAPLWAACCLRRTRMPKNFVALPCVRRCGLRTVLLHPYVYRECFSGRFLKHTYIVPELVWHSYHS